MANGRNKGARGDSGRDSGGFIALPWQVMDCPAYARLSHPARALLFELARQFVRDNNGQLLLSRRFMAKRGWYSNDVIHRAKDELLDNGFIFQTVLGHRPNKASWYAVTWRKLDKHPGYDVGAVESYRRGAYRDVKQQKNASLKPSGGVGSLLIAPSNGVGSPSADPSSGAMDVDFYGLSTPSGGHHLEMPSVM